MVLDKEDLELALTNNPYLKEKEADTSKIYFAFLNKELKRKCHSRFKDKSGKT